MEGNRRAGLRLGNGEREGEDAQAPGGPPDGGRGVSEGVGPATSDADEIGEAGAPKKHRRYISA
jgi:hypothetical protein